MKFDSEEYYPSISQKLLLESINYAKTLTDISDDETNIMHAREALLFDHNDVWVKKGKQSSLFDVTMGSYDGSEICEITGLFMLKKLAERFGKDNIGLYRDDGLALLRKSSGPKAERARKDLIAIFKKYDLRLTVESNLRGTDFLDIYMDLPTRSYRPYHKPNNTPLYVNASSNHPPMIIKRIPETIEKRISKISCNEDEFQKAKPYYEKALSNSGFKRPLEFTPLANKNNKNRKRNIIWFNPPYSENVKTNVGKVFFVSGKEAFSSSPQISQAFQ